MKKDLLSQIVEEHLSQFLEAPGALANIPRAWYNLATSRLAGENSDFVVLHPRFQIKTYKDVEWRLKKAMAASKDGYAIVWIEINDEPFCTVIKDSISNEYTIYLPDGAAKTAPEKFVQRGTGVSRKVDGAYKYIPAQYYTLQKRSFRPTDAVYQMYSIFYGTFETLKKTQPDITIDEFLKQNTMTVKALTIDENRVKNEK